MILFESRSFRAPLSIKCRIHWRHLFHALCLFFPVIKQYMSPYLFRIRCLLRQIARTFPQDLHFKRSERYAVLQILSLESYYWCEPILQTLAVEQITTSSGGWMDPCFLGFWRVTALCCFAPFSGIFLSAACSVLRLRLALRSKVLVSLPPRDIPLPCPTTRNGT